MGSQAGQMRTIVTSTSMHDRLFTCWPPALPMLSTRRWLNRYGKGGGNWMLLRLVLQRFPNLRQHFQALAAQADAWLVHRSSVVAPKRLCQLLPTPEYGCLYVYRRWTAEYRSMGHPEPLCPCCWCGGDVAAQLEYTAAAVYQRRVSLLSQTVGSELVALRAI